MSEMAGRLRTVELDVDGPSGGVVKVAGRDVSRLTRGVTITAEVGEPTQVVLDLTPTITRARFAKAQVWLDEETVEFLVDLGWIPPAPEAA